MTRRWFVVAVLAVLLLLVVPVSADWLSGWGYRKSHVINNTGDALSDYQIKLIVHRSDGSDSGDDVYIGSSGCEEDYDDIRFTKSDGSTLLDYWIEESDSSNATIWVEVDSIAGSGDTTIYLYYGNAGASAYSNGDDTFYFFDHFDEASINTTLWDVTGTISVSSSEASLNENDILLGKIAFGEGYEVRSRAKTDEQDTVFCGFRLDLNNRVELLTSDSVCGEGDYDSIALVSLKSGTIIPGGGDEHDGWSDFRNTYYTYSLFRNPSDSSLSFSQGGNSATYSTTTYIYTGNMYPILYTFDSSQASTLTSDWIFVRQRSDTEPTHGAWGEVESPYVISSDFYGVPTSGTVPLTVYFTDNSTSTSNETVIIDEWSWDFGDESAGSSDQNPAHQYTTSGTYTVALTASNATYGTTDTETKTDYITVNIDSAAPTADFVATPLCEDVGEPIYFIDYSTGGGLYAWNWSFGDSSYSELRNPTHSYASNGTYDISLTVWGANGTDTLTKTGYITIPCGAPTPTPTVTPTPTGTIPVQGDVDTGRISPLGFVMLAFINLGLVLHTFVNNESRNYLHVFTGIVAVIVSFMLGTFLITGFVQEDFVVTAAEVTVNSSVLSTYQVEQVSIIDAGVGYYFVFIGILMALIVILSVIEIIREIQEG